MSPVTDSLYTDPDALRTLYRNPKNPLRDTDVGQSSLSQTAAPTPLVTPLRPADIEPIHCPEIGEWTLGLDPYGDDCIPMCVKDIRKGDFIWHPIRERFIEVVYAQPVPNIDCFEVISHEGCGQVVSHSHPVIQCVDDDRGLPVTTLLERVSDALAVILRWGDPEQDFIESIRYVGKRDVMHLSLRGGGIFATGTRPDRLVLGHNKPAPTPPDALLDEPV